MAGGGAMSPGAGQESVVVSNPEEILRAAETFRVPGDLDGAPIDGGRREQAGPAQVSDEPGLTAAWQPRRTAPSAEAAASIDVIVHAAVGDRAGVTERALAAGERPQGSPPAAAVIEHETRALVADLPDAARAWLAGWRTTVYVAPIVHDDDFNPTPVFRVADVGRRVLAIWVGSEAGPILLDPTMIAERAVGEVAAEWRARRAGPHSDAAAAPAALAALADAFGAARREFGEREGSVKASTVTTAMAAIAGIEGLKVRYGNVSATVRRDERPLAADSFKPHSVTVDEGCGSPRRVRFRRSHAGLPNPSWLSRLCEWLGGSAGRRVRAMEDELAAPRLPAEFIAEIRERASDLRIRAAALVHVGQDGGTAGASAGAWREFCPYEPDGGYAVAQVATEESYMAYSPAFVGTVATGVLLQLWSYACLLRLAGDEGDKPVLERVRRVADAADALAAALRGEAEPSERIVAEFGDALASIGSGGKRRIARKREPEANSDPEPEPGIEPIESLPLFAAAAAKDGGGDGEDCHVAYDEDGADLLRESLMAIEGESSGEPAGVPGPFDTAVTGGAVPGPVYLDDPFDTAMTDAVPDPA